MSERVKVERSDGVATVVLDRPEKMNVLDLKGWEAIGTVVSELAEDADARCIVFRGTGERAFSAGSDISAFPIQRRTPEEVERYGSAIASALDAIVSCPQPTLAVIRGVCVGGGLEIAACCDIRICSEDSRFGAPISRLGLTMSHAELRPLVRTLGATTVLAILFEGAVFGAEHAARVGLVQRVVPLDGFDAEADATARRIAAGAPLVHRWHKTFVRQIVDGVELSDDDIAEAYAAFETEDYEEGVRAFLEKREPRFKAK